MDSITQALLGAATFGAVTYPKLGRKSLLIGCAVGTIPDLDVFLKPFYSQTEFLLVHRGFSHSIFFSVLVSLALALLSVKLQKKDQLSLKAWWFAYFIGLFTHPILDCFTTYGTQLFNPISNYLVSFNSISVIEPVYTLTLLFAVLIALFKKRRNRTKSLKNLRLGLLLSTCYLFWTLLSKWIAFRNVNEAVVQNNIDAEVVMVSPTPLNTVLWNGIIKTSSGYHFTSYNLFDTAASSNFYFVKSSYELIPLLDNNPEVKPYLHYCDNFPLLQQSENKDTTYIYAIKYGPASFYQAPKFIFPMCITSGDKNQTKVWVDEDRSSINMKTFWEELLRRLKIRP